jgi:hypothetical protein
MLVSDQIVHGQLLGEIFQGIALIKIAVAIVMVVTLSVLAEVVSPRFAGILSGYPLGAAISLFFFGYEISPSFAAQSALYTLLGLIATQVFAYFYYVASSAAAGLKRSLDILLASAIGVAAYFLAIFPMHFAAPGLIASALLPAVSIGLFSALFRRVENVKIQRRVKLSFGVLLLRSLVAAIFIILITSTAKIVGPRWAGLFSAFPITMLPFVVIIHFTYDREHVYAILKNVPKGIGSLVVYALAVHFVYPTWGIYTGTFLAYIFATLYLVAIHINLMKI